MRSLLPSLLLLGLLALLGASAGQAQDVCSPYSNCYSCVTGSTCGWCNGACRVGTSTGAYGGCNGTAWAWGSSQCPAATANSTCSTRTSCGTCLSDYSCGWCSSSNSCQASSTGCSAFTYVCPSTGGGTGGGGGGGYIGGGGDSPSTKGQGDVITFDASGSVKYFYAGRYDSTMPRDAKAAIAFLVIVFVTWITMTLMVCVPSVAPKPSSMMASAAWMHRWGASRSFIICALTIQLTTLVLVIVGSAVNMWTFIVPSDYRDNSRLNFGVLSVRYETDVETTVFWYSCKQKDQSDNHMLQCATFLTGGVLVLFYEIMACSFSLTALILGCMQFRTGVFNVKVWRFMALSSIAVAASVFGWCLVPHLVIVGMFKGEPGADLKSPALGSSWGLCLTVTILAFLMTYFWRAALEAMPQGGHQPSLGFSGLFVFNQQPQQGVMPPPSQQQVQSYPMQQGGVPMQQMQMQPMQQQQPVVSGQPMMQQQPQFAQSPQPYIQQPYAQQPMQQQPMMQQPMMQQPMQQPMQYAQPAYSPQGQVMYSEGQQPQPVAQPVAQPIAQPIAQPVNNGGFTQI